MSSHFRKCYLDLPPTDEPGENIAGASVEVGGEEGLRLELACGIADEKPTDRHRRHAAAIPDGGAAGDFDDAVGSAVPETDAVSLPGDLAILNDGGQLFQGLTFDRPPTAAFALLRWEVEQVGIEAQTPSRGCVPSRIPIASSFSIGQASKGGGRHSGTSAA